MKIILLIQNSLSKCRFKLLVFTLVVLALSLSTVLGQKKEKNKSKTRATQKTEIIRNIEDQSDSAGNEEADNLKAGKDCFSNKEYECAIDFFSKAIKNSPDDKQAYEQRAKAYFKAAENSFTNSKFYYDKAIEDYNKVLELNPKAEFTYIDRGLAHLRKSDADKAIQDFTKIIELHPEHYIGYSLRASCYNYLKSNSTKAIEDYTKSILLKPDKADLYYERGLTFFGIYSRTIKPDYQKAIEDYSKAIELDLNNTTFYESRARAYLETNNLLKAISDYSKIIELEPEVTENYYNRAKIYLKNGNENNAIKDLTKVIQLKPDNYFAYQERANVFVKQGKYDEAIKDYNKVLDFGGLFSPLAYKGRANVFAKMNDYKKALEDYNLALNASPEDAGMYEERGKIYQKLGMNDLANADFIKFQALVKEQKKR